MISKSKNLQKVIEKKFKQSYKWSTDVSGTSSIKCVCITFEEVFNENKKFSACS